MKYLLILLLLSACSFNNPIKTIPSQSITLNANQINIISDDVKKVIQQEFSPTTEFNLDTNQEFGKNLEQNLRSLGYGINPNSKNLISYFISQKQDKVFMHIQIAKINISRIYIINANKIMPLSPISITK